MHTRTNTICVIVCSCLESVSWYVINVLVVMVLLLPFLASGAPMVSITSGSSWLYVEWNTQSAIFRVLYRESGAPDYQVIAHPTSQLSHNISALQPNTLYNIVVEATHTVTQQKVNSSVTSAYTTPQGELKDVQGSSVLTVGSCLAMPLLSLNALIIYSHFGKFLNRW